MQMKSAITEIFVLLNNYYFLLGHSVVAYSSPYSLIRRDAIYRTLTYRCNLGIKQNRHNSYVHASGAII